MAQYIGRGDQLKANEVAKQGIISTTMISVLIMLSLFIFNRPLIQLVYNNVEPKVM